MLDILIWQIVISLSGLFLIFEDFTSRLISIWNLIFFGLTNGLFIANRLTGEVWLFNSGFCAFYIIFCVLILKTFYYCKERRSVPVLDDKLGTGDICLLLLIGGAF